MLLTITLWLFATTTVSGLFVCLDLNTEGRSWRNFWQAFAIIGAILLIVVFVLSSEGSSEDYRTKEQLKEQQWISNGCPVYKSECGSKHPYACEQKVPKEGRYTVGNIIVTAYKTC